MNKKYYSISEVAKILDLPLYKIRYLEKSKHQLKINKINKRRYYTINDINYLKTTLLKDNTTCISDSLLYKKILNEKNFSNNESDFLIKINKLLSDLTLQKQNILSTLKNF